jgi:hypothetical protein
MVLPLEIKPLPILVASAGAYITWLLYLVIYRLYFSPIAKFPGPKIAALTHWYECYYDVFTPGGGMYMWEIQKLHQKYGRVISARRLLVAARLTTTKRSRRAYQPGRVTLRGF